MEENKASKVDRISEVDRMSINLMELSRKLAFALAEKAAAEAQLEEFKYKNTVLQIYLKYGLSSNNVIDEKGNVSIEEPKSQ